MFLLLLENKTKSQTFGPDWPQLGHIRAKLGHKQEENMALKSRE